MPPAMTNPSPAQLGLALVILKNVPLGLSAQDYLKDLQRHFKPVESDSSFSCNKGLPGSGINWEQAYHDLERRCGEHQRQIEQLTADNEELRMHYASSLDASRPRKRKAIGSTSNDCKRLKLQNYSNISYTEVLTQVRELSKEDGARISHSTLALATLLATDSIGAVQIQRTITVSCEECKKALNDAFTSLSPRSKSHEWRKRAKSSDEHLQHLFSSLELLLKLSIMAIDRLEKLYSPLDRSLLVTAEVLSAALDLLTPTTADLDVESEPTPDSVRGPGNHVDKRSGFERATIYSCVSRLIVGILDMQGLDGISNGRLLDAFGSIILQRIGQVISALSLSAPKDLTGGETRTKPLLAPYYQKACLSNQGPCTGPELTKTAPHLILILEKLVEVLGFGLHTSRDPEAGSYDDSLQQFDKAGLKTRTRVRVQQQLIRAVFGDHRPDILSKLRRSPESAQAMAGDWNVDQGKLDVRNLFIDKVWQSIGWQTLAEELNPKGLALRRESAISAFEQGTQDSVASDREGDLKPHTTQPVVVCYCRDVEFGKMVKCSNPSCPYVSFHFSCIGLKRMPAKTLEWFCARCKSICG